MIASRAIDVLAITTEVRQAGFSLDWEHVDSESELLTRLRRPVDVAIASDCTAKLSILQMLELFQEHDLDVPLIVIAETRGEDRAVEAMKHGAADYLMKPELPRLGAAVASALERRRVGKEARRHPRRAGNRRDEGISAAQSQSQPDDRAGTKDSSLGPDGVDLQAAPASSIERLPATLPNLEGTWRGSPASILASEIRGTAESSPTTEDAPATADQAVDSSDVFESPIGPGTLLESMRLDRRRLRDLSLRLICAQEIERRRISRELHDETGQSLTALKIYVRTGLASHDQAQREAAAEECLQIIDRLLSQVRNLSLDLRPSLLDDSGLVPAIRWHVERRARQAGLKVRLQFEPAEFRAPAAVETACFRIIQEAFTNVLRHAHASQVDIELRRSEQEIHLVVRDNGVGFDPVSARERASEGASQGLIGMLERAALLGGRLEIDSAPEFGSQLRGFIPLRPLEAEPLTQ